ncbi:hypothetical protein ACKW6Q_00605 [Chryseobacterium kwangjuense]|uniref:Fibronectin type-III domain-containing protein n=1 Tax=Chryseobacterium kwangjuense TaxID=267125 RepID=A0ABW9JWH3_9FLAO
MKKTLLLSLLLIVSAFKAQININIGSTGVGTAPISSFFSYSYVQQIYLKQELNADAAGNITGLSFYADPSATITESSNWTVYLGHTTKTAFTSGTDWIPAAQLTQVFAGTVTASNGKVDVTFTTPFAYNNMDNLVIAAKENSQSIDINNFDEAFHVYNHLPNSTLFYKGDLAVVDPATPPGGIRADYKSAISILGLAPKPTPACPFVQFPANNAQFVTLTPNFKWFAASGADSYRVSVGTTAGATDVVNQVVTGNNFTPPAALNYNTTYYLRISSVSGSVESSGCADIMFKTIPPIPANDACSGAFVASVFPYEYAQSDAMSATNNAGFITSCADAMNDGTWFKFTGDGGQFTVGITMPAGSTYDPQMDIYSGSCGNFTCIKAMDNGGGGAAETYTFTTTAGTDYFINVGAYEETVDMPENVFTIKITKL